MVPSPFKVYTDADLHDELARLADVVRAVGLHSYANLVKILPNLP